MVPTVLSTVFFTEHCSNVGTVNRGLHRVPHEYCSYRDEGSTVISTPSVINSVCHCVVHGLIIHIPEISNTVSSFTALCTGVCTARIQCEQYSNKSEKDWHLARIGPANYFIAIGSPFRCRKPSKSSKKSGFGGFWADLAQPILL